MFARHEFDEPRGEIDTEMPAAQADVELRDALHGYLLENDFGPHRGIAQIAGYLAARQMQVLQNTVNNRDIKIKSVITTTMNKASPRIKKKKITK